MIYRLEDAALVTAYSIARHMDAKHKDNGKQYKSNESLDKILRVETAELLSVMISCFSSVFPV